MTDKPGTRVPLSRLAAGQSAVVVELAGGRAMCHRLAEMGVLRGTEVLVRKGGGAVIIGVRGHRLVIGRGMASHILVDIKKPETPA